MSFHFIMCNRYISLIEPNEVCVSTGINSIYVNGEKRRINLNNIPFSVQFFFSFALRCFLYGNQYLK